MYRRAAPRPPPSPKAGMASRDEDGLLVRPLRGAFVSSIYIYIYVLYYTIILLYYYIIILLYYI